MIERIKAALQAHQAITTFENTDMPAAVTIPLIMKDEKAHVLFQVRSKTLRRQPGEVSFPGGKYECTDISPWEAAKRETCEELGIEEGDIAYLGTLDYYPAPIGVKIYPFVIELKTTCFNPNQEEVDHLFCVPLQELLEITPRIAIMQVGTSPLEHFPFDLLPNYQKGWKFRKTYEVYFYPYGDHVIWGLTGTILKNFLDIYRKNV